MLRAKFQNDRPSGSGEKGTSRNDQERRNQKKIPTPKTEGKKLN